MLKENWDEKIIRGKLFTGRFVEPIHPVMKSLEIANQSEQIEVVIGDHELEYF